MEIKNAIIESISQSDHKLEPRELETEIARRFNIPRRDVRRAIGDLILERKLEFTYYGKNYLELPLPPPPGRVLPARA